MCQIGKIFVPRSILDKKGKLTSVELNTVRKEAPMEAYKLLKGLNFGLPVPETVYQFAERMNGSGEPQHLEGESICRTARILAVVNAFCSMVSPKSYRPAMSPKEAITQLLGDSGFDINIVSKLAEIDEKDLSAIANNERIVSAPSSVDVESPQ